MSENSTPKKWHTFSDSQVEEHFQTSSDGLSSAESQKRLEKYGANELPSEEQASLLEIIWRQFKSPLIYILVIAAIISLSVGDVNDAGFIGIVILLNTLIGAIQEWRAEKSSQALKKLLEIKAHVKRNGCMQRLNATEIVPGDYVTIESGDKVPADVRLVHTKNLEIDESPLTGESTGVSKDAAWTGEADTPTADIQNMVFAGSTTLKGRGRGYVVATGSATMLGQIATEMTQTAAGKSPLLERMEKFSTMVAIAAVLGAVVVGIGGIAIHGYELKMMLFFGIALAVSVIPEGLPAALTVALSVASTRMAKRGAIVRRLASVEALGSCTMIASDKTGTLTVNQITVRAISSSTGDTWEVSGEGYEPNGEIKDTDKGNPDLLQQIALAAVLCNEGSLQKNNQDEWTWDGDPTDIALLAFGAKYGISRQDMLKKYAQVHEIPFEADNKFSATYHEIEGEVHVFAKGAPETILDMCNRSFDDADLDQDKFQNEAKELAKKGYRVLGFGWKNLKKSKINNDHDQPEDLKFLGFMGMIDPLRPNAKEAVDSCRKAGITVCMITGDHPETALAIAKDLGIASSDTETDEEVITGSEIQKKSAQELEAVMNRVHVFARVAPTQKLKLVQAAQRAGHFVAVTGDGVNDAPALRTANIGVAMGKEGTDAARDASSLILSDDNFATIVAGVEEGRVAYDNVRNVIFLLVSTGAAELIALGSAIFMGLPLPLHPVQVLWLNLVTNGVQGVALAFEPNEGGVLERQPRKPSEPVFNRLMIERTILAGLMMGGISLGVFWWMLKEGYGEHSARNLLLLLFVLFESVHIANCRSETKSAFVLSPFRSPILLIGALTALAVHFLAMYWGPTQRLLNITPVSLDTGVILWGVALTVLLGIELHKWRERRKNQNRQNERRP